ncbi:hypothetical protein [Microbulbifer aggregans]|uniref:hypothetical protein n=1 Tax=Microbulbifer aggregans TaxID=1769779 RepID=UPI001CFE77C9|nr:hypothetical protein [Microbulbifer aggregans]
MTRSQSPLIFVLLFAIALPSVSHARDWYEYKSDNFTVYSDVSKKRVEKRISQLERFRAAALMITGTPNQKEDQRLKVFYLHKSSEFESFTLERGVVGFYMETWDGPMIFTQKSSSLGMPGTGVMYHEYIHHLMRLSSNSVYPMWYSEGFAEFLATAKFDDGRVTFGGFPEWRVGAFHFGRPLEVAEVLAPDYESDSSAYWDNFYGSAWFLTHYLQFGAQKEHPEYREKVREYIAAFRAGADPLISFEQVFGITPDEMEKKLRKVRDKRLLAGISFDSPEYTKAIARKKLPEIEAAYLLADKALEVGNEELAQEYLRKSLKLAPNWAPALSLQAVLENHKADKTDIEYAASLVIRLRNADLLDARAATNLTHFHVDHLQSLAKTGHWDHGLQQQAIELGKKAISLNPQSVPAHRYLWMAQMDSQNRAPALKTMMAAFQLDPESLYINQSVAFYLADAGRVDLAKPFLERVLSWSHPGRARTKAKNLLERQAAEEAATQSDTGEKITNSAEKS